MAEESDKDRMNRLAREAAERRKAERDEAIQRRLDAEAAEEEILKKYNTQSDDEFITGFEDLLKDIGVSKDDFIKAIENDPDAKRAKEAGEAFREAQKIGKKNPKKAAKIIKNNKSKIKDSAKAGKKASSGCVVVGALLISAFGGVGYGAIELISRLIG